MTGCQEHERLVNFREAAFGEWYRFRIKLEKTKRTRKHNFISDAQLAADQAYKKLRDCMDAVLHHATQHACIKSRSYQDLQNFAAYQFILTRQHLELLSTIVLPAREQ